MVVPPEYVLVPLSVCVPLPVLIRAIVPVVFCKVPEKRPLPPPLPRVRLIAPPAVALSIRPLPLQRPTVGLFPFRSSSPPTTASEPEVEPSAALSPGPICKVPPLMTVPPL